MRLSPDFEGQFVISGGVEAEPKEATRHRLDTVCVDTFDFLDVVMVRDGSGKKLGLLLGTPVDPESRSVLRGDHSLAAILNGAADIAPFVEEHIYRLSGSFLFVLDVFGERRAYLDANGSKSLVYDPVERVAAATTALLLDPAAYRERFQANLYKALRVDQDGWFPAGLTAHRGVCRLLCNHYLDLETWQAIRHWPAGEIAATGDADAAARVIVDQVRRTTFALARAGETSVALTAGYDTRLILACCRDFRDRLAFVTVDAPDAGLDVCRAGELSQRFGLEHGLLPYVEADAAATQAWQLRVSHGVTGANMRMHPSVAPLDGRFFVGGIGGEVGRGFLWLKSGEQVGIDAEGIVARLKLPAHPTLLARVEAWLKPLRRYSSLFILDLAFMELRVSCWAFAQAYAHPRQTEINPLISRRSYCAMLSLPPSMRRDNGMVVRCIRQAWPDLLALPFNRYGNWRDQLALARDVAGRPAYALRKIRQIGTARFGEMFGRTAEKLET